MLQKMKVLGSNPVHCLCFSLSLSQLKVLGSNPTSPPPCLSPTIDARLFSLSQALLSCAWKARRWQTRMRDGGAPPPAQVKNTERHNEMR